jgi:hypothetical protein
VTGYNRFVPRIPTVALVALAAGGFSLLLQAGVEGAFRSEQAQRQERERAIGEFVIACHTAIDVAHVAGLPEEARFLSSAPAVGESLAFLRSKAMAVERAYGAPIDVTRAISGPGDSCESAARAVEARRPSL